MESDYSSEIDHQRVLDPWGNPNDTAQEILQKRQQVNYQTIVNNNRVILLGEEHGNSLIRNHMAIHAGDLRSAGITHYAIEATSSEKSRDIFARLHRGEQVDLSGIQVGPFVAGEGRSNYERAIRAMANQGIRIVPIDVDQTQKHTSEEREVYMMDEIQKILEADPSVKVAVLIGGFHTSKTLSHEDIPYLGKRIVDANIPAVTIQFAGGTSSTPRNLLEGAKRAGLANQEFMLDMKPYAKSKYVAFGAGQTDFVIHLPQQQRTSSMDFGFSQARL